MIIVKSVRVCVCNGTIVGLSFSLDVCGMNLQANACVCQGF